MLQNINEEGSRLIIELLEEILFYYEDDNWLVVKKYILRYLKPEYRRMFSTRHPKTKKHSLNNFEKYIIQYCKDKYSKVLILNEKDTHYDN